MGKEAGHNKSFTSERARITEGQKFTSVALQWAPFWTRLSQSWFATCQNGSPGKPKYTTEAPLRRYLILYDKRTSELKQDSYAVVVFKPLHQFMQTLLAQNQPGHFCPNSQMLE